MATAREQLADLLRQARIEAGLGSHGALAKRLNVSRPVITKAENPRHSVPSDALLAAWAGATGAPLDKLTDLAQRCRSGTPEWFMSYRQAEADADTLRCWSPVLVPGMLQCESYARAVLAVEDYTPEELDGLVAARLDRHTVTGRAYLTAIIDHYALQRLIGSAAVMAEQCSYLASIGERPRTVMHVVPEGQNVGLWGAFYLATRDNTTTVCLSALEDMTSTEGDLVAKAVRAYERILGAALPRAESLARIRTAEEEWKSQI